MSSFLFSSGGKIDDAVGSGGPKTGKESTLLIIKLVVPPHYSIVSHPENFEILGSDLYPGLYLA